MAAQPILVTGAAGFIGFHVARRLLDRGRAVIGVDNLNAYYDPALKEARLAELARFETQWSSRYPAIAQSWRANWERVRPFFAFPASVRKLIYTTNAIESLNFQLRKIIQAKGHFPTDEAATKLLYLALRNVEKKWIQAPRFWKEALNQFAIHFEGRLPA